MPIGTGAFTKSRRAFRAGQPGESLVDYLLVIVLVIVGVTGIYSFFKQPLPEQGASAIAPDGCRSPDTKDRPDAPRDATKDGARNGQPDAQSNR